MENLRHDKNIALIASAGTGKTFNLSLRYVSLLLKGEQMEQILCLTFTVKATAEMQEKIITLLKTLAEGDRKNCAEERRILKEHLKLDDDALEKRASQTRDRVLKNFSKMRIRTLDSFINQIISRFPFEADIRPGFTVIMDAEKKDLDARAFAAANLRFSQMYQDLLRNIADIMETSPYNLMDSITGQTGVFENQLISMNVLEAKYKTDAGGFKDLTDKLKNVKHLCLSYARAFGSSLLLGKLNGNQAKQAKSFSEAESIDKIASTTLFQNNDPSTGYFKTYPYQETQTALYFEIHNKIIEYLNLKGELYTRLAVTLYSMFFEEADALKKKLNRLAFSDITVKAYKMLVEEKLSEKKDYLYFRLDGRILHILIDEFQDTSLTQWKILEPLVEQALAGIGQQEAIKSFFYVGDPKQTLYRFRGGESRLFDTVTEDFEEFITQQELGKNFRSDKAVISLVNTLFSALRDETFRFTNQTGNSKSDGYAEIRTIEKDENEDYALQSVGSLISRGFRLSDIAILVETNAKAAGYEELLMKNGIPARSESSGTLRITAPFRAVEALFSYIIFRDSLDLFAFHMYKPSESAAEALMSAGFSEKAASALDSFAESVKGQSSYSVFRSMVNCFFLAERFENDPNFAKVCGIAAKAEATGNIYTYLEHLRKLADSEKALSSSLSEAVTVMTIHKSKGLQFKAVVLPDLNIKTAPAANHLRYIFYSENDSMAADSILYNHGAKFLSIMPADYREAFALEQKAFYHDKVNLLYVAMTRAEKEMYIAVNPEPSANTVEKVICDNLSELPISFGVQTALPAAGKQEHLARPERKYEPLELTEPVITEESDDYIGEIFGQALHEGMFLINHEPETLKAHLFNRYGAYLCGADIDRVTAYLTMLVGNALFKEITENASVFKERGFMVEDGYKQIDFYAVKSDAVFCLDFKTGRIEEKMMDAYTEQIDGYAEILEQVYALPVIKYLVSFADNKLNWIRV
jgi:exodeoxyribonuclease V beta subunit